MIQKIRGETATMPVTPTGGLDRTASGMRMHGIQPTPRGGVRPGVLRDAIVRVHRRRARTRAQSSASSTEMPAALQTLVGAFGAVPDPMLRYKQLLHLATTLEPLDAAHQTPENKVEGCVSQVWVRATLEGDGTVLFSAESDSQLTKGLAALLVKGLSGATPNAIVALTPDFIGQLGLQQSLTPSRNNGFLNMFLKMQRSAAALAAGTGDATSDPAPASSADDSGMGMAQRIEAHLGDRLSPSSLAIRDDSADHAGHRPESAGGGTHFRVDIVSDAFEGLSTIKRHQAVYQALSDLMEPNGSIHALSLSTKTQAEAER